MAFICVYFSGCKKGRWLGDTLLTHGKNKWRNRMVTSVHLLSLQEQSNCAVFFFFLMKTLRVHYVPYCSGIFFCSLGCTAQCVGFVRGTGYVRENTVGCTMGYYHRCGALWSTTKDMSVIQRDVGMEMMPAQGASICTCLLFFCIFFNVSILCERAGDVLSKYHKENKWAQWTGWWRYLLSFLCIKRETFLNMEANEFGNIYVSTVHGGLKCTKKGVLM